MCSLNHFLSFINHCDMPVMKPFPKISSDEVKHREKWIYASNSFFFFLSCHNEHHLNRNSLLMEQALSIKTIPLLLQQLNIDNIFELMDSFYSFEALFFLYLTNSPTKTVIFAHYFKTKLREVRGKGLPKSFIAFHFTLIFSLMSISH